MHPTQNVQEWLKNCREHNANAIRNTATGKWLGEACGIIESLLAEIQTLDKDLVLAMKNWDKGKRW